MFPRGSDLSARRQYTITPTMLLAQAFLIIAVQTLDSASSAIPQTFISLIKPSIIHHKYKVKKWEEKW